MREGEGGIGCIIQKGRGEGCQLLLHVGHSIHRATTVTTIIFVAQEGKIFLAFRFTNLNNKGCWADEEKQDNSKKEKKDFCPLVKKGMRMKNLISKLFHLNG